VGVGILLKSKLQWGKSTQEVVKRKLLVDYLKLIKNNPLQEETYERNNDNIK
jgi:hypothetical protein